MKIKGFSKKNQNFSHLTFDLLVNNINIYIWVEGNGNEYILLQTFLAV